MKRKTILNFIRDFIFIFEPRFRWKDIENKDYERRMTTFFILLGILLILLSIYLFFKHNLELKITLGVAFFSLLIIYIAHVRRKQLYKNN